MQILDRDIEHKIGGYGEKYTNYRYGIVGGREAASKIHGHRTKAECQHIISVWRKAASRALNHGED